MSGGQTDQLEYYLSSLDELGEILINADRARSVGVGILRHTLGTVMASKGAIFLYNNKENQISFLSSRGVEPGDPFKATKALLSGLNKYRHTHVLLNRKERWITGQFKKYVNNSKTKAALPLYHQDRLLGVLCVGERFMGEKYSIIDLKILQIIANHLTKALYNYQLINDVEEKKTEINLKLLELETLFDISVAISSVLDIDELSEEVLWRSVGILNASKGLMVLQKEGSPILEPTANFNWGEDIPLISKKLSVFSQIKESKKGVVFSKIDKSTIQKKLKEENLIIVPLRAKDKTQGYMLLSDKETRKGVEPFSEMDLDFLTALCNQAAVAMDNAKLFKEITKEKQFNESILGSIATGVITLDPIGEIDSINTAGLSILKMDKESIVGNHYMFLFEKDEHIIELITLSEMEN